MKYPLIKLQKITFLAFILFNIKTLNVKNSNANANCNEKECFQMSSSKNVVPEAKEALNRFKMEAANEVGVFFCIKIFQNALFKPLSRLEKYV